jgi:hypothetical protein
MPRLRKSLPWIAILVMGAFEALAVPAEASLILKNPIVQPVKDPLIQYEVTAVLQGFDQSHNPIDASVQSGDSIEIDGLVLNLKPGDTPAHREILDPSLPNLVADNVAFQFKGTTSDGGSIFDVKWTFAYLDPTPVITVGAGDSLTIGRFQVFSKDYTDAEVAEAIQVSVNSNARFRVTSHIGGTRITETGPLKFTAVPEPSTISLAAVTLIVGAAGMVRRRESASARRPL